VGAGGNAGLGWLRAARRASLAFDGCDSRSFTAGPPYRLVGSSSMTTWPFLWPASAYR
jgi:hypothetical protein